MLFSGCGSPSLRCSWVNMQRSFFLPAHLQKQDGWWISWKSNFYFSGPVLFYAFPCFLVNHHFPRGTAEKIKVGKATLKRTIFFDIFLFTTKTEQSRETSNTDWFIGVLFRRYRMEHWRKTTSSVSAPLRSWVNSVLLENRCRGFLLSWLCLTSHSTQPQTLNSIITGADSSSPWEHWVWLILSDPLLAAFFIFMGALTSLWDH